MSTEKKPKEPPWSALGGVEQTTRDAVARQAMEAGFPEAIVNQHIDCFVKLTTTLCKKFVSIADDIAAAESSPNEPIRAGHLRLRPRSK